MKALILGAGEAFDESFPNTSVLIESETNLLLDCGFSVPPMLWRSGARVDALYLTHAHADHFFGVPAVLARMCDEPRRDPLPVVTQHDVWQRLRQVLELAYPGSEAKRTFPLVFVPATAGTTVPLNELTLRFAPTRHGIGNLAVRVECGGRAICLSGDGAFTEQSKALYKGADLLFHEAYSFEQRSSHAHVEDVVAMAVETGVKRLALTHIERHVRMKERARLEALRYDTGIAVLLPRGGERIAV
ncbi:MAG: ribonuclease Z [Bryobacterales bacterium]|nr:ribonuclease Z [Bryobacterales bacterium]